MVRVFLVLLIVGVPAAAVAGEAPCAIPGALLHWQADYCMARSATDDFLHADVQACFEAELGKPHANECAAKAEYKKGLCEQVARWPPYNGSIAACIADPAFAGRTVREGGV